MSCLYSQTSGRGRYVPCMVKQKPRRGTRQNRPLHQDATTCTSIVCVTPADQAGGAAVRAAPLGLALPHRVRPVVRRAKGQLSHTDTSEAATGLVQAQMRTSWNSYMRAALLKMAGSPSVMLPLAPSKAPAGRHGRYRVLKVS